MLELAAFDLLPPAFYHGHKIRQVAAVWVTIGVSLIAALCAVGLDTVVRIERDARTRSQLVATAIPLLELRERVIILRNANAEQTKWCRWVDSARPHDDVLQTLAVLAQASDGMEELVKVDRIQVRLPVEQAFPSEAGQRCSRRPT